MNVLLEFAMFPTDKGISVSEYVSQIIDMVRNSGYPYKLSAMGTIVETPDMGKATEILNKAQQILEPHSDRIYCTAKFDIKKSEMGRLEGKIASVEGKIGKVNH
ncbi:thiamine-binding protein [Salinivirga cyanobacteriivorans]